MPTKRRNSAQNESSFPGHSKTPIKTFTVESANAALPLVRAITADLAAISRELSERRQRISQLLSMRSDRSEGDPYDDELAFVEQELEQQTQKLQGYVDELRQLGVEPKPGPDGEIATVDFPSLMDGRLVYLCWRYGEPEVLFWHHIDAGFAGRQSLTADVAADGAEGFSVDLDEDSLDE